MSKELKSWLQSKNIATRKRLNIILWGMDSVKNIMELSGKPLL